MSPALILSFVLTPLAIFCNDPVVIPDDDVFYLLQPETFSVATLAAQPFHWAILEPTQTANAAGDFSPAEVATIRDGGPCRKILLAYLSIGEAEIYRDYWDPAWVDSNGIPVPGVAPAWLGDFNPEFEDNYKVRYWDPAWQALIFGSPGAPVETPLDRIIDQGFDGVYLDIIDAYEYWSIGIGDGNELDRMVARAYMVEFVEAIAHYARVTRQRPGFRIFPQNAAEIIRTNSEELDALSERYFAAISGIGREDLFYDGLDEQDKESVDYSLLQLHEYAARGKTVIAIDYVIRANNPSPAANAARVAEFYAKCQAEGFVPYAAYKDRNLDEIVSFGGAGWSVEQPAPGCPLTPPGDVDTDGDVDEFDAQRLARCLAGPTASTPPAGCPAGDFALGDLDDDGHVDLRDFALLDGQRCAEGG